MANALNEEIKPGDKIVLRSGVLAHKYDNPDHRIVTASDVTAFGNHRFTAGTALFVELWNGHRTRIHSVLDIDPDITAMYRQFGVLTLKEVDDVVESRKSRA